MKRLITALALVAVGLVALAPAALAAHDTDPGERWDEISERRLERRAEFAADLAAELGVTQEEVDAALEAVVVKRLDEAVAAGSITQERADHILGCYQIAMCHPLRHLRHHWGR